MDGWFLAHAALALTCTCNLVLTLSRIVFSDLGCSHRERQQTSRRGPLRTLRYFATGVDTHEHHPLSFSAAAARAAGTTAAYCVWVSMGLYHFCCAEAEEKVDQSLKLALRQPWV